MQIQTHLLEKANNRCHETKEDNGSTLCRVPRYPLSTKYTWRKVSSYHSDETLQKLFGLELAQLSQSQDGIYGDDTTLQRNASIQIQVKNICSHSTFTFRSYKIIEEFTTSR